MRSSVQTLEKHYLKNGGVGDEPEAEPEQQQQQLILNEINKNIVETPLKQVVYKCWGTTLKLFFRRWLQKFQHHTPTFVNKDR